MRLERPKNNFPYSITLLTTISQSSRVLYIRTKLEDPPLSIGRESPLLLLLTKLLSIITSYLLSSALYTLIRVYYKLKGYIDSEKLLYLHSSEKVERGKEELRIYYIIYDILFTLHG